MRARCLRCGKTAELNGWQCLTCFAEFGEPTPTERAYTTRFLQRQERGLINAADQLDGAGYWAVAKAVQRASARVEELLLALQRPDR